MNNEEKILAMLEKLERGQLELRGEISVLKEKETASNGKMDLVILQMKQLSQDIEVTKCSALTTEHDHYPRIQAALDGFATATEHNEWQDQRIQAVEETVQRHDIEIFALKEAIG